MQLSTRGSNERVAAFLRDAEKVGLVAEVQGKVERERDEERKQLALELKRIPGERDKRMRPVVATLRTAEARVQELQARVAEAESQYAAALATWHGTTVGLDRREFVLRQQLVELAPEVLGHTDIKLDRLADSLRNSLYFRSVGLPALGGPGVRLHHSSNLEAIEPILAQIKNQRVLIEEMVYLGIDHATAKENCSGILEDLRPKVVAIGVFAKAQLNEILGTSVTELPPRVAAPGADESLAARAASVKAG